MKRRIIVLLIVVALVVVAVGCLTGCCKKQEPEPGPPETTDEPTDEKEPTDSEPTDPTGGGDFDVSGAKWIWIEWNADGDGEDEEMEFEYHDNGDEAASAIEVTLYKGDDQIKGWIDNSYKINRILSLEDEAGPYLQVDVLMGDYYSHDNEGHYFVRLVDGELKVEYHE